MYSEYIDELIRLYSLKPACSSISVNCADFWNRAKPKFRELATRAQYIVQPGGNANVADNDVCVRLLITDNYWMDDFDISSAAKTMFSGLIILTTLLL